MSHTKQAALAPALDHRSHVCTCAAYTSHGYYSRAVFISLRSSECAAAIRGWQLFENGVYLKKYGLYSMNSIHMHPEFLSQVCLHVPEVASSYLPQYSYVFFEGN